MREQAKIENYQQGKAMLNEALANSGLSDEAKAAIKEHAKTNGMAAGLELTAVAVGALNASTGKIEPPRNGGPKVLQAPVMNGGPITILAVLLVLLLAAATVIRADRSHKVDGVCDPKRTLASCFDRNGRMEFSPDQQIDQGEFDELLEVVYKDINRTPRGGWDIFPRWSYDTPFFTGNSHLDKNKYPDNIVCIGDRCDNQSHVNYFAQGMYSAKAGETLEDAFGWVAWWNENINNNQAQPGEYYWTEFGYNYFVEQQQNEQEQNEQTMNS
jgi:hypothetical protein